jgi:hypothetical protein
LTRYCVCVCVCVCSCNSSIVLHKSLDALPSIAQTSSPRCFCRPMLSPFLAFPIFGTKSLEGGP